MTRQNARKRAPISTVPRADRLVEDEDAAHDRGEVGGHGGECDDLDTASDLEAAGGGVEGDHSGDHRGQRPRAHHPEQRPRCRLGEVLDCDIGEPEQRAGGRAEEQPLGARQDVAAGRDPHECGTDPEDRALDGDQRRQRGAVRVVGAAAGQADDHEPGRCDRDADPLSPSEVKAEEPLGEHGEEDEAAGEDRLHDRQRRERGRAGVQTPGHDRHDPADQEPSGAKQSAGAAQRMAGQDRRGEHRAAVLEQEGEVGGHRRSERQEQS
jgi:hypothetical protein